MTARTRQDEFAATSKYCYQVKDWTEYDRALVNRSNSTIWFNKASLAKSSTLPKPVGHCQLELYLDVAIQICLALKTLLRLSY